jgi:hypothetical protein
MFKTLSLVAAFVGCAAILSAQAIDPDTYKVNYFTAPQLHCLTQICSVPGLGDSTVRLTNVGTSNGNVCADIYVFDPYQELTECCSCRVTPDGLLTLSVSENLTSNPLTGISPSTGAIKIVSSSTCNAASPKPAAGIRAWATHIQNAGYVTETEFSDSGLSAAELGRLASECSAIQEVGSGSGVCSCGGVG